MNEQGTDPRNPRMYGDNRVDRGDGNKPYHSDRDRLDAMAKANIENNAGAISEWERRHPGLDYIRQDGLYMHYKRRDIYRIVCTSVFDELGIGVVTYQSIKDGGFWTRTISNFNGYRDGMRRFMYIGQHQPQ